MKTGACDAPASRSEVSRPRPFSIFEAENAIVGQPWNEAAVGRVQRILDRTLQPVSDHRGSKEYRLEVSKSLVEKYQWELPL